ncbi:ABC transporter permease, partial [Klebsiella pneumoniae]|nr:ABC transporter permease [Klebsiella pneumoniae]
MRWVNRQIRPGNRVLLGAAPVVILIIFYLFMAASRHAANPSDKILPLPGGMVEAMSGLLSEPDALSGQIVFWADTLASLQRLGLGLAISTVSALLVGLVLGVLPPVRTTFGPL